MFYLQIREELRANGIDVYPQKEFDEDAEDRLINDKIRVSSDDAWTPPTAFHISHRNIGWELSRMKTSLYVSDCSYM